MCIVPLMRRIVAGGRCMAIEGRRTKRKRETIEVKVVMACEEWGSVLGTKMGEQGGRRTHEDSVIELDRGRVLEHVPPPAIGLLGVAGVEVGEELFGRRDEVAAHEGEVVVYESSIEACDEGSCDRRENQFWFNELARGDVPETAVKNMRAVNAVTRTLTRPATLLLSLASDSSTPLTPPNPAPPPPFPLTIFQSRPTPIASLTQPE